VTATKRPNVYIVAGPNGAGKSTFARLFLPAYADCREFVNADLIAAGLSPFNPERLAIEAGRLMLKRIETLAQAREDFGFETTLAGRSHLALLTRLKEEGYRASLLFLWLPSSDLAIARVRKRVESGGHSIPDETVRRRYSRGLSNLFYLDAKVLDTCLIFDSSKARPRLVASRRGKQGYVVLDSATFARIQAEAHLR
jgi:predicted ABC-type ATPase